jgi:hypothetical protein
MIFNEETLTIITVNANNKGVVMYSFKNPGGTLLNPTNKFACLIGSGRVASTVIVDKTSLLLPLIIATPTFVTIISCLDEQEIGAIAHPTQINNNPHNLCCSASFLLAPWVLGAILEADSNNPATLLLATNDAANKFNHSHENNPDYITDMEEQHAQITKWLWAVQAGLVPRTNYSVEQNNDNLLDYTELHHSQHILPCNVQLGAPHPPAGPPPVFPAAAAANQAAPITAALGNNQVGIVPNLIDLLQVSIARQVGALK